MSSPRALLRLCSRQAQLFSAPRSAAAPARRVHTASRHQSQLRQHQAFLPQIHHRRAFSCTCAPRDSKDNPNAPPVHVGAKPDVDPEVPAYNLTFTCRVCTTRSAHRITKQGYHEGTVLVSCPGCKNRHLISDHLKVSCAVSQCPSGTAPTDFSAGLPRSVRFARRYPQTSF